MDIGILMPNDYARSIFITPPVVKGLEGVGSLTWNEGPYSPKAMIPIVNGSDIVIVGWGCCKLDETVLAESNKLKLVVHTGGTVAGFVTDYMFDKGIRVISGNKIFAESVAEGTLAYILTSLRRIPFFLKQVQEKGWSEHPVIDAGLLDKSIGLVGFGAIPRYLAPMLRPFRVKIQAYDPYVADEVFASYGVTKVTSMKDLFSQNSIISVHLPMQPETNNLIDKDILACMPDGALLVNTARGNSIDEDALAAELKTGRINAVLDVYKQEPLAMDSPLRGVDNALLMPHNGGPTHDRYELVTLALIKDIKNFIDGKPMEHEIPKEYAIKMTKEY